MEDTAELRQSIKTFREGKDMAKTFEVFMRGSAGKKLEQVTDNANFILSDLENQHEHFITDKYTELEEYIGLSYDEVRDHHAEGFRKLLLQQYRLFKKEQTRNLAQFNDGDYIKDLATGYTFDYIRTLTLGKKMDVPASVALQLAEYSYWNNPNILISLAHQFPDADPGLITSAATNYPTNPEAFIEKVLDSIPRLQEQFPDADPSFIKTAAIGYPKNPEAFIQKVLDSTPGLQEQFPDADPGLIKVAAIGYPTNPEAFIQEYNLRLSSLEEKYKEAMPSHLLKKAAFYKDPEKALQRLLRGEKIEDE